MKLSDETVQAVRDIVREYQNARQKHREMHSAHEGYAVILEELEELWDHVKHDTAASPEARKEAVQLGAMALAFIVEVCDKKA